MNNLNDISINERYATMLGYTQEELEHIFSESIDEGFKATGLKRDEYLKAVKKSMTAIVFIQTLKLYTIQYRSTNFSLTEVKLLRVTGLKQGKAICLQTLLKKLILKLKQV